MPDLHGIPWEELTPDRHTAGYTTPGSSVNISCLDHSFERIRPLGNKAVFWHATVWVVISNKLVSNGSGSYEKLFILEIRFTF